MKKIIKKFVFISSSLFLISCASTSKNDNSESETVSQEQPSLEIEQTAEAETVEEVKKTTPLELYLEKTAGIKLSVVSAPKETTKKKAFSGPYTVKATKADGTPAANFEISVECPAEKDGDKVTFSKTELLTNDDGVIVFDSPVPESSFKSVVKFYPAGDISDTEVKAEAEKQTVSADYKVVTNLKRAGGVIAIVDFNTSGKPVTTNPVSSSNLLMTLMQKGFVSVGNIDLTADVLRNDKTAILKNAKALVGNNYAFLIYGTVKYGANEKTESGHLCTLVSEINCISLRDGSVLYHTTQEGTAKESSEWAAVNNARKKLSENLANAISYGI